MAQISSTKTLRSHMAVEHPSMEFSYGLILKNIQGHRTFPARHVTSCSNTAQNLLGRPTELPPLGRLVGYHPQIGGQFSWTDQEKGIVLRISQNHPRNIQVMDTRGIPPILGTPLIYQKGWNLLCCSFQPISWRKGSKMIEWAEPMRKLTTISHCDGID